MIIKKYQAKTKQAAMKLAREELGLGCVSLNVKEIKQKDDSTYRSLEEKNKALSDEIDELKNINLSTLEQKVVMIIDLLAKQGESLTRVSNSLETIIKHLEGAARANWGGKPYVGNW